MLLDLRNFASSNYANKKVQTKSFHKLREIEEVIKVQVTEVNVRYNFRRGWQSHVIVIKR